MTREFLKKLGLEDAAIDQILDENMDDIGKEKAKTTAAKAALTEAQGQLTAAQTELEGLKTAGGDIAAVRQQLTELQAKYDTDTKALQGQLADRDYGDAISRAIAGRGLKFSSKSAERAFTAEGRGADRSGRLHQGPEGGGPRSLRPGEAGHSQPGRCPGGRHRHRPHHTCGRSQRALRAERMKKRWQSLWQRQRSAWPTR